MINLASLSLSAYMILLCSVLWFHLQWITGLAVESRKSRWQITEGSISGMFSADQANTYLLAYKKLVNNSFSRSVSYYFAVEANVNGVLIYPWLWGTIILGQDPGHIIYSLSIDPLTMICYADYSMGALKLRSIFRIMFMLSAMKQCDADWSSFIFFTPSRAAFIMCKWFWLRMALGEFDNSSCGRSPRGYRALPRLAVLRS